LTVERFRFITIRMVINVGRRLRAFGLGLGLGSGLGCDQLGGDGEPEPLQGIVELDERVLAFEIAGRIKSIRVDEGDPVAPGQELAQLDDTLERLARDARAAEARATKAELELLLAGSRPEDVSSLKAALAAEKSSEELRKRTVVRERPLGQAGVITAEELDVSESLYSSAMAKRKDAEAQLLRARHGARSQEIDAAVARAEASQSAVRSADERIARHVLRTDNDGLVLDVHLDPDEFGAIGAPIVTIADVQHPYVDVYVPQARVNTMQVGTHVEVKVDSRDAPYAGTVEYVSRETEFTPKFLFSERERPNLVIRVRVRIDAPEGDLQAGVPAFAQPMEEAS
jgi:multidrug resistance efflux pump